MIAVFLNHHTKRKPFRSDQPAMYLVITPDKVFGQYQLTDYFNEPARIIIVRTVKSRFFPRRELSGGKPARTLDEKEKKLNDTGNVTKITDYLEKACKCNDNPAGKNGEKSPGSSSRPSSRFNLVPVDNSLVPPVQVLHQGDCTPFNDKLARSGIAYRGCSKYKPFTLVLEEEGEIFSRYSAGLIHGVYLLDFDIPGTLAGLGLKDGRGFGVMELFITLYFLSFINCKSLERFAFVNSMEFMVLTGKRGKPAPDTIRKFLKCYITPGIARAFSEHVYRCINRLDPWMGYGVYIDEHLVQYQGAQRMAKGKGSSARMLEKGFYRFYLTSVLFKVPLYCLEKDGSARLEPVLFDVLEAHERVSGTRPRMVMFDRGVKSFKTLKKLDEAGYWFACWSFPYKSVIDAINQEVELEFQDIAEMTACLISTREDGVVEAGLPGEILELKCFSRACLPEWKLEKRLRAFREKRAGRRDWSTRDFLRACDSTIEFESYGPLRTIILEKVSGEKIAILTNIPREHVHAIEIIEFLKGRQNIENFFKFKIAIAGDYVFSWHFKEAAVLKTRFKFPLVKPAGKELAGFATKKKKTEGKLEKLEKEREKLVKMQAEGKFGRQTFKKLSKVLGKKVQEQADKLKEINAFIEWGETSQRPGYFDRYKPVMELDVPAVEFINAINDLFYTNSRRIAADWGNALERSIKSGELAPAKDLVKNTRELSPGLLNFILLNSPRIVRRKNGDEHAFTIELHVEMAFDNMALLEFYLKQLNQSMDALKLKGHSSLKFRFTTVLDKPPAMTILA